MNHNFPADSKLNCCLQIQAKLKVSINHIHNNLQALEGLTVSTNPALHTLPNPEGEREIRGEILIGAKSLSAMLMGTSTLQYRAIVTLGVTLKGSPLDEKNSFVEVRINEDGQDTKNRFEVSTWLDALDLAYSLSQGLMIGIANDRYSSFGNRFLRALSRAPSKAE